MAEPVSKGRINEEGVDQERAANNPENVPAYSQQRRALDLQSLPRSVRRSNEMRRENQASGFLPLVQIHYRPANERTHWF